MNRLTIFLLITLPLLFACTQKEQEVRVESVSINQSGVRELIWSGHGGQ